MKYLILLLASVASADRLENAYLPPDGASASGASAGLQTPLAPGQQNFASLRSSEFSASGGSSSGGSSRFSSSSGSSSGGSSSGGSSSGGSSSGSSRGFGYSSGSSSGSSSSGSGSSFSSSINELLKYDNEITEDGYYYAYEISDGTKVEQQGRVFPGEKPEEGILRVKGSYSYIGDDGQTYSVTYTADENGYHAEGAHLPTPPPTPEAILRSLKLTDRANQYDSQKSSYDADAENSL